MNRKRQLLIAVFLTCAPTVAYADAGVPMIMLVTPLFSFALIPIILFESNYLAGKLDLAYGKAAKTVTLANLASTFVGVPLTWMFLVFVQLMSGGNRGHGMDTDAHRLYAVTMQAPWLIPYEEELHWMVPSAMLVLFVPFFLVTWLTEYWVARLMLKEEEPSILSTCIRNANIITYAFMSMLPLFLLTIPSSPQ